MKLLYSIYKEYKVLIRDRAGLAITFIMPTILVLIITLIQDTTFRSVNENAITLLLVDRDHDSLSVQMERALNSTRFFEITKKNLSNEEAREQVAAGKYIIGIIVPEHTSEQLRKRSGHKVATLMASISGDSTQAVTPDTSRLPLQLYFDPITKKTFQSIISNSLERILSQLEMQNMVTALNANMKEAFPLANPKPLEMQPLVSIREEYASPHNSSIIPNSVQHNVPAWSMFAMFFICIPLAGNIIREREDGSAFRLLTMPGSYMYVILGKMLTYVIVSLLQFTLMMAMGIYILPMLGLPQLNVGDHVFSLFVVALASGLAATGFGLLVGTVSTSHDQASLFGAVFVIMLAAIGGVWVPTFVMPEVMRKLSGISPLNWGLEAFYGIFLRNAGLKAVLPQVLKLFGFFLACLAGAFYYQKYRRLK